MVKELYLLMKGWEKLYGTYCVGCNRDNPLSKVPFNFLNMKVAEHWPMCIDHAFRAQTGHEKGIWRQSSYYDGRGW